MGKPSNNQTTQRATASEAYDPRAEQVELERATPPIKTQAKLDSSSTLTASLTSRPASPSVESARHETAQSSPALDGHDNMPHGVPASFADEPSVLSAPKPQRASGLQKALAQVSVDAVTVDDDDDDDDDVFFDALEYLTPPTAPTTPAAPTPKHQRAIGIQQAPYDPELEGAPKGRTTVPPRGARPPRSAAAFASPPSSAFAHLGRGPSSSVAAPPPLGQPPAPHAIPRPSAPAKKGLLVGVNYDRSDEKNKLKYAVRDAKRFGQVLAKTLGFPEENLVFITDEERPASSYHYGTPGHVGHVVHQPNVAPATERWQGYVHHEGKRRFVQPSHYNFIRGCQWLTKDAKAGDELIMLFSGHCVMHNGQPYLVMPDGFISKRDLYRELVSKVPQGCRFTFVPDCCHSAALVDLPYCVGKMGPKPASTEPQEVTVTPGPSACPTDKPAPESERSLQTSLYGVRPGVIMHEPEPAVVTEHLIPPGYNTEPFAPPSVSTAAKRQVSVVAAPAPAPVAAASTWIPAWLSGTVTPNEPVPVTLEAASTAATGTGVRRTRNCVVEATRPTDYFEERKAGFDPPAGDVTVWAAAGAGQYAFEASGKVKHGIVTNALCNALESCENISYRDLWGRIQDAIESENVYRHSRDQAKDESQREAPEKRVQHAEMWVSRRERLSCAAAVLDGRAFCPVVATPLPKADVVAAGANLGARTRSFTSFMAQPHGTSV